MRRHLFAVGLLLLLSWGYAHSQSQDSLSREGLTVAKAPRQYQPPSATATPEELEELGDDYRNQKAYADAIDYYRAALKRTSDKIYQATLHNKIGIAELQMQRYKQAQKSFERAVKCDNLRAEAYNNTGAALYLQKKHGKAIGQYKKAIKLRENDASFHMNLGAAYFSRKQIPLAVIEYRRALELDPEILEHNSRAGIAAVLSSPEDRAYFNYLFARMYAQAGDFDRSLRYLRKAMEDGYKDIKKVYEDQEFAALRVDPRFSNLMAGKPAPLPE